MPGPVAAEDSCDWCYSAATDASRTDSERLGLVDEYAHACDACLAAKVYRSRPPEGWDPEAPWPFLTGERAEVRLPASDLACLPRWLQASARVEDNGEVAWLRRDAPAVINALADQGRVVLGLDLRSYDGGHTFEVPLSDHSGSSVEAARVAALAALAAGKDMPGEWVLITW